MDFSVPRAKNLIAYGDRPKCRIVLPRQHKVCVTVGVALLVTSRLAKWSRNNWRHCRASTTTAESGIRQPHGHGRTSICGYNCHGRPLKRRQRAQIACTSHRLLLSSDLFGGELTPTYCCAQPATSGTCAERTTHRLAALLWVGHSRPK